MKSSKNDSPTSPIDENTVDDNVTCRNRLLLKTTTTTSINTNNGGSGGNDLTSITTNDSGLGSDDSSLPSTSDGSRHVDERPPADSHYTKIRVPSTAATSSATAEVVSTNINKNNNSSSSSSKSIQRRSSVLQNFTISSYRSSKPTEIFHDESVKTSKTTQLAINNHPSARISSLLKNTLTTDDEANKSNNNLIARHSSFSNNDKSRDYKSITPTVKRSKSTISLLSGNYAKFNRLIKKQTDNLCREGDGRRNSSIVFSSTDDNTAEGGTVVTEELDDGRSIVETSSLKKYSSEISVDKG